MVQRRRYSETAGANHLGDDLKLFRCVVRPEALARVCPGVRHVRLEHGDIKPQLTPLGRPSRVVLIVVSVTPSCGNNEQIRGNISVTLAAGGSGENAGRQGAAVSRDPVQH